MASLSVAGGQESESVARHLRSLGGTSAENAEKFLHEAVEELVRPAGVAAAEAQAGRTRAHDDVVGSAKIILVEVWRRLLPFSWGEELVYVYRVDEAEASSSLLVSTMLCKPCWQTPRCFA